MHTREQRQKHRQCDGDVECAEQHPKPPGGALQQDERSGIAEGEALARNEVDEEPGDPDPVRVLGDEGAEDQGKVEAPQ